MNIITQNPFRVLGLTGNSSERELQKQIGIIKRYAEIGKSKTLDYDFEFMGNFSRTLDDIKQAASNIEQAQKKLHYSLFWFVKNNQFDEIALNNLKDQNIEKAIEIWNKTLKEEVSNKNYSSYLNLSTLYIALSTLDGQLDFQSLQAGIDLKGNLIHSDNIKDFSKLVTGNGLAIDSADISKKFIEEIIELLKPYLNKNNGISTNELISLFNSYPKNIQKYLSGKFTEVPISNIENKIDKTLTKRKENPRDAEEYGEELFKTTKTDIKLLKKLLGKNNVQFQMIANKLANEIMQCAIDYFNIHREDDEDIDPGEDALRIAKYALSIGPTGQIKQRIEENIAPIQEWIDIKEEREKRKLIKADIEFIYEQLYLLNETDYIDDNILKQRNKSPFGNIIYNINLKKADKFITKCYPRLKKIYKQIGSEAEISLQLSSAVVNSTLELLIDKINNFQERISLSSEFSRLSIIFDFKIIIGTSVELIHIMTSLAVFDYLKVRLQTNKDIIWKIAYQLDIPTVSRREKKQQELQKERNVLTDMINKQFLHNEIHQANSKMKSIMKRELFRSKETRQKQIIEQQTIINKLIKKSEQEKASRIRQQKEKITKIGKELKKLE
ncbi:MAG: hypothetical protein ISS18_04930 [Bacteroidales bacterium]|nr:hypothetical protein [Bacteroidales bacterium]